MKLYKITIKPKEGKEFVHGDGLSRGDADIAFKLLTGEKPQGNKIPSITTKYATYAVKYSYEGLNGDMGKLYIGNLRATL